MSLKGSKVLAVEDNLFPFRCVTSGIICFSLLDRREYCHIFSNSCKLRTHTLRLCNFEMGLSMRRGNMRIPEFLRVTGIDN